MDTTTYTYDTNNNMTGKVCQRDIDNNNSIDYTKKYFYTYIYDTNRNIIKKISQTDTNGDGVIDLTTTEKYIWEFK